MFRIFYKMMANYYAMKHLLSKSNVSVSYTYDENYDDEND